MVSIPVIRHTPEQYLELERNAEFKSEYASGEMLAMAGASREHALIVGNLQTRFNLSLESTSCETYANVMKVNVGTAFFYPDIVIACHPDFLDNRRDIVTNPVLIVEVLSKSTEGYDLNYKLSKYSELPSLRELLYISQNTVSINHLVRQADRQWLHSVITDADAEIHFTSIDCTLTVAQIYARVQFAPSES